MRRLRSAQASASLSRKPCRAKRSSTCRRQPVARTAAGSSSRWARMSRKCSSMCPPVSRSFAMSDRNWPAYTATTLRRRMHRHGRFRAEWPDRPCWHTCWSGSSAITCRSIGRVPFMPGVVWAWIARGSPNGWAIAMNCCPRWSRRSGVMCWAAPRSMRMTPRYPSSLQVKAEPRPHVYGRMFGMIARLAAMILRRSGLPTPKTGRGAILANT